MSTKIYNNDLLKKKYDESILATNMVNLNKRIVLFTQILTAEFCVKYIADSNINGGSEDSYLFDTDYILDAQPHINEEDYAAAYKKMFSDKIINKKNKCEKNN